MNPVVFSTSTGGYVTPIRGDRRYVKDELRARGLAAGFTPEQIEWAIKKFRAV